MDGNKMMICHTCNRYINPFTDFWDYAGIGFMWFWDLLLVILFGVFSFPFFIIGWLVQNYWRLHPKYWRLK